MICLPFIAHPKGVCVQHSEHTSWQAPAVSTAVTLQTVFCGTARGISQRNFELCTWSTCFSSKIRACCKAWTYLEVQDVGCSAERKTKGKIVCVSSTTDKIMHNEIHKFAVCCLSRDLAVSNSNRLNGFPLFCSRNWNITYPHRNKPELIITEVTSGTWIKTPVEWYITINPQSCCRMRFKVLTLTG